MRTMSLRSAVMVVFAFACFLTLPSLHRPFFSRGEPREALVAAGMLSTGNWISPPAYDGAVPSKPPFTHWIMAAVSLLHGEVTEISARIPSAVGVIIFLPLFCLFVAKRTDATTGLLASLMLLSMPEWFRAATSCRVDTVLSVCLAAALLQLFAWQERGWNGVPWLAVVCLSGATLTKGPIGFCLPAMLLGVYLLLTGRVTRRNIFSHMLRACGLLLPVLLVASLWYLGGYFQRGDEFLSKVWYENFQRLSGTMEDEPHRHGIMYLWGLTYVGLLPWSIVPLILAGTFYRSFRTHGLTGGLSLVKEQWDSWRDLTKFAVVVSLCTLLFFSIPSSKRSVYVLPAYPFLALLLAQMLRVSAERIRRWISVYCKVATALSLAALVTPVGVILLSFIAPESVLPHTLGNGFLIGFSDPVLWVELLLVGIVVLSAKNSLREVGSELLVSPALATTTAICLLNATILTGVAPVLSVKYWIQSQEFREIASQNSLQQGFSFGSERYDVSFYLKMPFRRLTSEQCSDAKVVFHEARHSEELRILCSRRLETLSTFQPFSEGSKKELYMSRLNSGKEMVASSNQVALPVQ